jgi:hypothetical protein
VVKEFLDDNGCSYESIDVAALDDRWRSFGAPALPALVVGGVAHAVSHPVQVATLLDLPVAAVEDPLRIGFDLDRILAVWVEAIVLAPWEALLESTPSRGRTGLELAVNVFVPAGLLSSAFATGTFAWPGDPVSGVPGDDALRTHESAVVAGLGSTSALLQFARPIRAAWAGFLEEAAPALRRAPDREVTTPAGALPYRALLDAQRLHAAQHLRQVTTYLAATGRAVPELRVESLGARLPAQIY